MVTYCIIVDVISELLTKSLWSEDLIIRTLVTQITSRAAAADVSTLLRPAIFTVFAIFWRLMPRLNITRFCVVSEGWV